jgi:hypothetical protein
MDVGEETGIGGGQRTDLSLDGHSLMKRASWLLAVTWRLSVVELASITASHIIVSPRPPRATPQIAGFENFPRSIACGR